MKPSMFIGSSVEGLPVAREIQASLEYDLEVTIWNEGVFPPGRGFLEALTDAATRFDFALLIAQADDFTVRGASTRPAVRDNVLFELGLFMGSLGRERTFFLYNRDSPPSLPSDLAGVVSLTYPDRADGNLKAAIGPACTELRLATKRLGLRDSKRLDRFTKAADDMERVEGKMATMIRLLVRSRKVELDLISRQFGIFISPDFLAELRRDLDDLDASLADRPT